jgi:hypothetical protein
MLFAMISMPCLVVVCGVGSVNKRRTRTSTPQAPLLLLGQKALQEQERAPGLPRKREFQILGPARAQRRFGKRRRAPEQRDHRHDERVQDVAVQQPRLLLVRIALGVRVAEAVRTRALVD